MAARLFTSLRVARRIWLFRLAAVVLGTLPLVVAELLLASLGHGRIDAGSDPFVGFDSPLRLFELNDTGDRYQISPSRYPYFRPDGFAARKTPNELRIFCLGGSTVQGRPYAIETSFTTWLELSLQAADPQRNYDVVNCGGISYASYRLVPILEEVLHYEPDLIVLYTGHNEFLEDRTYAPIKQRSATTRFVLRQSTRLRSLNCLRSWWNHRRAVGAVAAGETSPAGGKPRLSREVDARLDHRGGLAAYRRDPNWRRAVVAHFDYNVRRMIRLCQVAEVDIWIVDPVCNLSRCPPFKSQHRDGLRPAELARWQSLRQRASRCYRVDMNRALDLLEHARSIDDQHAGLHFDLGTCYESRGRFEEARAAFSRAKEEDVCPLRAIEPLRDAIRAAAAELEVPLIDVHGLIARECRNGIPGGYLMVDHVHPSITGHQMIAQLLAERMIASGRIEPDADWTVRRDRAYALHTASLDDAYYFRAQTRLEGLRRWAAGRATVSKTAQAIP
jgi:lysophospholipase L1-like esterase